MLIEKGKIVKKSIINRAFSNHRFEATTIGFFYLNTGEIGEEAIGKIYEELLKENYLFVNNIRGNYVIHLYNKENDCSFVFVDNSGVFKAFINGETISTSFLDILKNNNSCTYNYKSIVEFIRYGYVFSDNTLINEIKKLDHTIIYKYDKDGKLNFIEKELSELNHKPDLNPIDFFSTLQTAIKKEKISIDLTGGTDTRLLISALEYFNADYELAISGMPYNKDIKIGFEISKALNKTFYPSYHDPLLLDKVHFEKLWEYTDCQFDILLFHRLFNLIQQRQERGITMHLSGAGGELYKDFWWLQDFPFYNSRHSNIEKLYKYRIEAIIPDPKIFGVYTYNYAVNLQRDTIQDLKKYVSKTNTQTYDSIYYRYKMHSMYGAINAVTNTFYQSYVPLLELDLVRYGFSLPRRKRFYNNFHRSFISKYCSKISRIQTDGSITCSANYFIKTIDLFRFSSDLMKRIIKQLLRKITRKTYFQENPSNPELIKFIRNSDLLVETIAILKREKIVSNESKINDFSSEQIGRIISLGKFVEFYSGTKN